MNIILDAMNASIVPWQKPWFGCGSKCGYPVDMISQKRFSGINFILSQIYSRKNKFSSKFWIKEKEVNNSAARKFLFEDEIYFNADQFKEFEFKKTKPVPNYQLAEKCLFAPNAKIIYNDSNEAFYVYRYDYISIPRKESFISSFGGIASFYDILAHELMHWSETRLKCSYSEIERELRAEIGSAMLMEELQVPHNIIKNNYNKYVNTWKKHIIADPGFILRIAESAFIGFTYILSFSEHEN